MINDQAVTGAKIASAAVSPGHIKVADFAKTTVADRSVTLGTGENPTTTSSATTVTTISGRRYFLVGFGAFVWPQNDGGGWPYNAHGSVGINGTYSNVVRCDPRGGVAGGSMATGAMFAIPFTASSASTSITARITASGAGTSLKPTFSVTQAFIIPY